jgi:hypothetical protein
MSDEPSNEPPAKGEPSAKGEPPAKVEPSARDELEPQLSSPERRKREANARTLLGTAAASLVIGLALAASGDASISRWLTLFGLFALAFGLHRFGRLGADPSPVLRPRA